MESWQEVRILSLCKLGHRRLIYSVVNFKILGLVEVRTYKMAPQTDEQPISVREKRENGSYGTYINLFMEELDVFDRLGEHWSCICLQQNMSMAINQSIKVCFSWIEKEIDL